MFGNCNWLTFPPHALSTLSMNQNNPFPGAEKIISFLKKLSIIPILVLILLIVVPTMIYTVGPDEDAVILRFGKYTRTTAPGLHLKWPFNFETVSKVPVRKVLKMEFGYRTINPGVRSTYSESNYERESIMLTGDLNIIDASWIIQYQVKDAKDFLFNVARVDVNLYDISQAVIREVMGDRTVSEAINEAREEIEIESLKKMQKILDDYKMGVHLLAIKLQDVTPPEKVKPSFDDVNAAVQDASQTINIANRELTKLTQEEQGKAEQTVKMAEAYAVDVVNRAKGDAARFTSLYEEYRKAPDITKKRLYFESIRDTLKKTDQVYVVDPEVKGLVPLLQMKGGVQ